MDKTMEFEVTAFTGDGKEDQTWVKAVVTKEEQEEMLESEFWMGFINDDPKMGDLVERIQDAAKDWVPFQDEDDVENIPEASEYDVSFPQEVIDEIRKKARARRKQYKLKGLRWGYDGGGIGCGPVEGSVLIEAMASDGDGKLFFVSLSRFTEFAKVMVSHIPLFDILMQLPDWDLNVEYENDVIEKCEMKSWEFENNSMPSEMLRSDLCGIFKLLLLAENWCPSDERGEDFKGAQSFFADYMDHDGDELMDLDLPD